MKHTSHAVIIGPDRYTYIMIASASFYLAGKHSFEALKRQNKRPSKILTQHPTRLFSATIVQTQNTSWFQYLEALTFLHIRCFSGGE